VSNIASPGGASGAAESEWQIVGAMIRGGATTVAEVTRIVRFEDFVDNDLCAAFRHIMRLSAAGVRVTPPELRAALTEEFSKPGHLYAATPADSANNITSLIFTAAVTKDNAAWHAQRVAGAALGRRVRRDVGDFLLAADNWQGTPEELVAEAQRIAFGFSADAARVSGTDAKAATGATLAETMPDFSERFWKAYEEPVRMLGYDTGFSRLNRTIKGLRPGRLHVVAAASGEGKSAFAGNIVTNSARLSRVAWHVHSLEMERDELIERMVFAESQVDSQRYMDGQLSDAERRGLEAAMRRLQDYPITVYDDPNITIPRIAALARDGKRKGTCDAVLVDYTQLVTPATERKGTDTREREVAEIIRSLKLLAGEIKGPIIALSQLNDDGKVRESRAIKQDADVLMMLRPEEEYKEAEERAERCGDYVPERRYTLVIEKMRGGKSGTVGLKYRGALTRFDEEIRDEY